MDNHLNEYDNGNGYNNNRGNGSGGNGNNGSGGNGQPPRKPSLMMLILAGLSTVLVVFMLWNTFFDNISGANEVSYTQFLEYLKAGRVDQVEVQSSSRLLFTLKTESTGRDQSQNNMSMYTFMTGIQPTYSTVLMEDLSTLTARLEEYQVEGSYNLSDNSSQIRDVILYVILPVVLMWILLGAIFRKMGGV